MGRVVALAAFAAVAPNAKRGPSSAKVGTAIVVALPFVALAMLGVQVAFVWLWRRFWPTLGVSWIDAAWLVGGLGLVAAACALLSPAKLEWAPVAFWLMGCSYAAIALVVMRIMFALDAGPRLVVIAQAVPALLYLVPSVPLVLVSARHAPWEDAVIGMCIFPGMGGWVPGGIALVLLSEALIRGGRAAAARRASPAPRAG
jgi:hypothetical protein